MEEDEPPKPPEPLTMPIITADELAALLSDQQLLRDAVSWAAHRCALRLGLQHAERELHHHLLLRDRQRDVPCPSPFKSGLIDSCDRALIVCQCNPALIHASRLNW